MGDKKGDENTARERWGDERLIIKETKWMIIKSDGGGGGHCGEEMQWQESIRVPSSRKYHRDRTLYYTVMQTHTATRSQC